MKTRDLVRRYIQPAGAVLEKKDGDHWIYRFPNGQRILVPMGGKHSEAKPYLVHRVQQAAQGGPVRRKWLDK